MWIKLLFFFTTLLVSTSGLGDDGITALLDPNSTEFSTVLPSNNSEKFSYMLASVKNMNMTASEFEEFIKVLKHRQSKDHSGEHVGNEHDESHGISVVSWHWDYVKNELVLTLFFIVIGLFKLVYHHTFVTRKILPESCCLIFIGIAIGFFFVGDATHASIKFLEFKSKVFFFYLLPPIILESAYSLKDRAFIENIGTILLYAVVGTILNIVLLAAALLILIWVGIMGKYNLSVMDILTFASLVAAVDPVAVLAVFQEVGVNKMLYFMVFGESLFNDAVTIVCYNLAIEFQTLPDFTWYHGFLGLLSFLCVSIGGLIIGLICGAISSFVTKFTTDVRVVEPVVLFGMAYLAYLGSEMFHFSGIIALIACGLFQTHYACCNISYKSFTSVMYITKVCSTLCESLIFIILGVMLVNEREWFWTDWHPVFSAVSVVLCVVVRFGVTFFLTYFVNQFTGGVRHISFQEQFIMSYGGLRGAVSFSLVFMISANPDVKNTMLGATYAVILFTNIIQGSTIKLFVKWLNIRLAKKEDHFRLFIEFNNGMVQHLSQGIEDLCGDKSLSLINRMSELSKKYVRPLLEKNYTANKAKKEGKLVELNRAVAMREALNNSPSQSSFQRQHTIDEMAESGALPHDLLDEEHQGHHHHGQVHPDNEDADQRANELIKDVSSIRQLMHNPFEDCYLDRNLTHEEEKEQARLKMKKTRAFKFSSVRKTIGFFGKKKSVRRHATQQGILHSAIATIGVQSVDRPSTSTRVSVEDEEQGLTMKEMEEEHPLMTITESEETSF
ncbi:Na(+)/H(+) exchanger protein 7 [Caenorhabditis elegans]|uniref:Na(+)/H(+) exchanger protein 7 n=1 Tax=Caenorhabditis elegans TaxID=6239 RepID=PBO4_CAEEL|nr:Na(+)/H(+) exchanger protein 7 [Caenorhabditis elegans]G5EBK1.1 RecName: Full=Na(+)/H(+) exchanger protein 7; AltName: Full=Na(+)/H(+) antiporter nhx-7; AltName: Full=PBoc defective protein pbo-4 [Caenorhabditis elegans]AAM18109.1 putative Na-H exchanger isoform 7 [Caenorhabditis elegans]CAA91995.2 Na(+)/H(+) exchanger protein 7 [Caenorhabditis elegans]|eukprot:NP_509830.2 Na(+)/H(+) exchanger protein 7 [Caenorhabditis elegans]